MSYKLVDGVLVRENNESDEKRTVIYEFSTVPNGNEKPLYILMTGAYLCPKEQYEADYEPKDLDDLFYCNSICNGSETDLDSDDYRELGIVHRVVNGISYDFNKIEEMIDVLQKKPKWGNNTKYFVIQTGRFDVEEFGLEYMYPDALDFSGEPLTGTCYIVVIGLSGSVEEYLDVFHDKEIAKAFVNSYWDQYDSLDGREISILEAHFDKVMESCEEIKDCYFDPDSGLWNEL